VGLRVGVTVQLIVVDGLFSDDAVAILVGVDLLVVVAVLGRANEALSGQEARQGE
jgi:hypothetical protein